MSAEAQPREGDRGRLLGFRRVIYVVQWPVAFVIPLATFVIGLGGYEFILATPVAVLSLVGLLAGPIVSRANTTMRVTRAVPASYAILAIPLWIASACYPLGLDNATDAGSTQSFFEVIGATRLTSEVLSGVAVPVSVALWMAAIITLSIAAARTPAHSIATPSPNPAPNPAQDPAPEPNPSQDKVERI